MTTRSGPPTRHLELLADLERTLGDLRRSRTGLYDSVSYGDWETLTGREAEILAEHGYLWVPGVGVEAAPGVAAEPDPEVSAFQALLADRYHIGWVWSWLVIVAALGVALAHWLQQP